MEAAAAAVEWPVVLPFAGDARDALIMWLYGEFAAANAMVDLLLGHLRAGAGGREYDAVAAAVDRRRMHWSGVLRMQQFFPVDDVARALSLVAARRCITPPLPLAARIGARNHAPQPPRQEASDFPVSKDDDGSKCNANSVALGTDDSHAELTNNPVLQASGTKSLDRVGDSKSASTPTEFSFNELVDGKMVNIFQGLKLYDGIIDTAEVNKLLSWANEVKHSGRQGGLEGQSFIVNKRPIKGHGREVIQLGIPIVNGPYEDGAYPSHLRSQMVEPMPTIIQDLFNRLIQEEVFSHKPDYCVVDFFDEGDYNHPQLWPSWYGKPIATICLTDCDIVFGRTISADTKGDHRGPLQLSLTPGSLLVHQGRSLGLSKRAIPAARKERVILTFGKLQPKKNSHEVPALVPATMHPTNHWIAQPGPTNVLCYQQDLYQPNPNNLVVPLAPRPLTLSQLTPDGIQVVLVHAQNAAPGGAIAFAPTPTPVSQASSIPSGTGVFIPPSGSIHPPSPPRARRAREDANSARCLSSPTAKASPAVKASNGTAPGQECNGSSNNGNCGEKLHASNGVQKNGRITSNGD